MGSKLDPTEAPPEANPTRLTGARRDSQRAPARDRSPGWGHCRCSPVRCLGGEELGDRTNWGIVTFKLMKLYGTSTTVKIRYVTFITLIHKCCLVWVNETIAIKLYKQMIF